MMKTIGKVHGGELLLRKTSLKEYGLLIGNGEKITQSIYWNTKLDMLCALERVIEVLTESDEYIIRCDMCSSDDDCPHNHIPIYTCKDKLERKNNAV